MCDDRNNIGIRKMKGRRKIGYKKLSYAIVKFEIKDIG
jgi:hypothetical protein